MRMKIMTQGIRMTNALDELVRKRISFALSRFEQRKLKWVEVRLADINGPKGGIDKQCRIHVGLAGQPDLIIEDTESDLRLAIDRASDRVGRMMSRMLGKKNRRPRELGDHKPAEHTMQQMEEILVEDEE